MTAIGPPPYVSRTTFASKPDDMGFDADAGLDFRAIHEAVQVAKAAETARTRAVEDGVLLLYRPVHSLLRAGGELPCPFRVLSCLGKLGFKRRDALLRRVAVAFMSCAVPGALPIVNTCVSPSVWRPGMGMNTNRSVTTESGTFRPSASRSE